MHDNGCLAGKVVLITGAGRGIGREIALLAAKQGARVVVNDLGSSLDGKGTSSGPAQEVVALIEQQGGQAIINGESVSSWEGAQRMVEAAIDHFGRLDAVVNNAGILRDRMFHQMEPQEFDDVVKVHLYGSFYVSRAAAPIFRKQEHGAYVHTTSTSGLIGGLGQANYSAAKLGVVALSKSIALDMARFNVRSNCISPSAFSRMIESIPSQTPEEQAAYMAKRQAASRPEQIAPLAVFLASDAAKEVNGQIIGVRGNELYLYSQPRPVRTLHRAESWTVETLDTMVAAWKSSFVPLERGKEVFSWEPL